ncbi:MAG: SRPBCC domain-containing protein [Crocinitomicaceae bacterium]|nr:SRPBCC domain-containing protein [Crocinitomicaceae bacterium]
MHNWLFINDDFKTTELNVDFVTGGHFSYVMASKVGDLKYEYKATYSSIRPFEKILMTLDDGRKANVLFSTSEQRTFMQMEFEPYPYQDSRAQILGWQAILDNFKKFVESI